VLAGKKKKMLKFFYTFSPMFKTPMLCNALPQGVSQKNRNMLFLGTFFVASCHVCDFVERRLPSRPVSVPVH
jgi:hypothetical protein